MKKIKMKKIKEHQTEIFEYIRRRKSGKVIKVGVILGTVISPNSYTIRIGWSKCNFKAGDKFSIEEGIKLAKKRAYNEADFESTTTHVPNCIRRQIRQFGSRCIRYFKDAHKLELPV